MNIGFAIKLCGVIIVLILIGELYQNKEWQSKLRNIWTWYKTGNSLELKHQLFTLFVVLTVCSILRFFLGDHLFRVLKFIIKVL